MSFALCYWILMLFALAFSVWSTGFSNWKSIGGNLLLFALLLLIGWKLFGAPIHG